MYDFRIRKKIYFGVNAINHFGIYQPFHVSLLEPRQNNLSKDEAYLEPCQTSKMECFGKIFNNMQPLSTFEKSAV